MATSSEKQDRRRDERRSMVQDELEQKFRELREEDDYGHALNPLGRYPEFKSRNLSSLEMDLRDWGFMYGLAFGLALNSSADLTHEEAATAAFRPAWQEYVRWSGEIEDPVARRENAIRKVVRLFDEVEEDRGRWLAKGQPQPLSSELSGALGELVDSARA